MKRTVIFSAWPTIVLLSLCAESFACTPMPACLTGKSGTQEEGNGPKPPPTPEIAPSNNEPSPYGASSDIRSGDVVTPAAATPPTEPRSPRTPSPAELERRRAWNLAKDAESLQIRLGSSQGNHLLSAAAIPAPKPRAIDPFVEYEVKDANGLVWEKIGGSPERLQELLESDSDGTYVTSDGRTFGPPIQINQISITNQNNSQVNEIAPAGPQNLLGLPLVSPVSPVASAPADQADTVNQFFANLSNTIVVNNPQDSPANIAAPKAAAPESAPVADNKEPQPSNLTIINTLSVNEGSAAEALASASDKKQASEADLMILKKAAKPPHILNAEVLEPHHPSRGIASADAHPERAPSDSGVNWMTWFGLFGVALVARYGLRRLPLAFLRRKNEDKSEAETKIDIHK